MVSKHGLSLALTHLWRHGRYRQLWPDVGRWQLCQCGDASGINAGAGGFDIDVAGATDLVGAVISNTADPTINSLTTSTLSASDLAKSERYKASSLNISARCPVLAGRTQAGQAAAASAIPMAPASLQAATGRPPTSRRRWAIWRPTCPPFWANRAIRTPSPTARLRIAPSPSPQATARAGHPLGATQICVHSRG